jgi:hypothetical protein
MNNSNLQLFRQREFLLADGTCYEKPTSSAGRGVGEGCLVDIAGSWWCSCKLCTSSIYLSSVFRSTMKLTSVVVVVVPLLASAETGSDVLFRPYQISYRELLSGGESLKMSFVDALSTTGIISVTDIPGMEYKDIASANLHECATESKATEIHKFSDGTQRLTLAAHSLPGFIGTIDHKVSTGACESFNQAAASFRSTVATATQAFADRMADFFHMEESGDGDLLSTATNVGFHTIANVVENGEHLEHFHSYQKLDQMSSPAGEEETIEWHVDQGLFLAFTPGRMYQGASKAEISSGFFIKDQDEAIVKVEFNEEDDLVFMLGDGVNQYVNHRLSQKLRAVPHALTLSPHGETEARVWYGRMVLPPVDAVHPSHGITFGELRERMIESSHSNTEEALGMGCSGDRVARDLQATTCEGDSIYCWHRCMDPSDFGTSADACLNQDLQLLCINPRRQISDGMSHGDYYPGCADAGVNEEDSAYPTLPEYPRPEDSCTAELYEAYSNSDGYDHVYELNGNATFMWSVENNTVSGRLVFDGLFGWIAFGFANVGGGLNGMLGATIIMAQPGGNYTAASGLDLNLDPTVEEYVIDPEDSAFRHWMTPVTSVSRKQQDSATGLSSYEVDSSDCFTSLYFDTASIHNMEFNLTGSDELLWAANGQDYFVGYHGNNRGRFAIHWPTGELTLMKAPTTSGDGTSSGAVIVMSSLTLLFLTVATTFQFLG